MDENMKLKRALVLQSFAPLFILLLVQNFQISFINLSCKFFTRLLHGDRTVIYQTIKHKEFLLIIVVGICLLWIIASIKAYFQFSGFQTAGFEEDDGLKILSDTTDAGLGFFMTFVLPLVLGDLGEIRNFLVFILILMFVIILIWRTNLYYQNPVLTIIGYRTFKFKIDNPEDVRLIDNEYIGITKNKIQGNGIIKYQYIADDVFVVYDKNRRTN